MVVGSVPSVVVDALRVAVLLAAAAPIAWTLARGPARARATLWLAVLVGCLVTPALTRLVSPIDVVIPGWVADAKVAGSHRPVARPPREAERRGRPDPSDGWSPAGDGGGFEAVREPRVAWRGAFATAALTWMWGVGAAALLLRTLAGYWRIGRIVARATPVDDLEWCAVLRRAARRVGVRRRVRLVRTHELDVPATTGLLRPTVLLPVAADRWLEDRREVVMLHELVHVRRLDWTARIVARTVTALHWFDPLAWWASSRLDREQERACDEAVLGAGVRASTYAAHLLEIARTARPRPALSVPALELTRRCEVEDRIMHVLDSRGWRRSAARLGVPALLVLGPLVPAVAAVRPAPQQTSTASAATAAPAPPAPVASRADATPGVDPAAAPLAPPSPTAAVATPAPPASPELSRLLGEVDRLEAEMELGVEAIDESVRLRMEEKVREIERARLEVDARRMEAIEARIEAELALFEDLDVDLEPVQADIEAISRTIEAIELDPTLDEEAIREAVEPHVARLQELHRQMEPVHRRVEQMHESLQPLVEEMARAHAEMELEQAEVERLHAELEPLHAEVERLHESIEPVQRELERTAKAIDEAVVREVETAIRSGLSSVVAADAPFGEAARRVVAASHVHIRGEVLTVDAPADETRAILRDLLSADRQAREDVFEDALDAAVRELTPLRRSVEPR